jgi:hypothetical protein
VLKRILGPKEEEISEIQKKLHNKELRNLYSSRNSIGVIKSKKIKLE